MFPPFWGFHGVRNCGGLRIARWAVAVDEIEKMAVSKVGIEGISRMAFSTACGCRIYSFIEWNTTNPTSTS